MSGKRKILVRAYLHDNGRIHLHIDHVLQDRLREQLEWKPSYKQFKSAQVEIVPIIRKAKRP